MKVDLEVQGSKMDKLYNHIDAAKYCNISVERFLEHTNVKATLAYKLVLGQRLYTQAELDRFKVEVLGQRVKL